VILLLGMYAKIAQATDLLVLTINVKFSQLYTRQSIFNFVRLIMKKLHLGCGKNVIGEWDNLDSSPSHPAVIVWQAPKLPYDDISIDFIFSEHFIEHLDYKQGQVQLQECYRVLKPNGVLRISCPDLEVLAKDYLSGQLSRWEPLGWVPSSPCLMLNEGMRSWGHQFLWDWTTLKICLVDFGFQQVYRVDRHESIFPELKNLESRPYCGDLIVEAIK
jgi:predicted SAM-dependent methyltransferase